MLIIDFIYAKVRFLTYAQLDDYWRYIQCYISHPQDGNGLCKPNLLHLNIARILGSNSAINSSTVR